LRADSLSVTYRELWRTLELAFQAHGKELVRSIAAFPPAQRLGFDRLAIVSLGRLWSLVDWVVLTKKDASRALEFDELELLGWIDDVSGSPGCRRRPGDRFDIICNSIKA
jgi:hypothetical protein